MSGRGATGYGATGYGATGYGATGYGATGYGTTGHGATGYGSGYESDYGYEPEYRPGAVYGWRDRVLVVGTGPAGMAAADELRRLGFAGELTVLGDEAPYDRPA